MEGVAEEFFSRGIHCTQLEVTRQSRSLWRDLFQKLDVDGSCFNGTSYLGAEVCSFFNDGGIEGTDDEVVGCCCDVGVESSDDSQNFFVSDDQWPRRPMRRRREGRTYQGETSMDWISKTPGEDPSQMEG